MLKLYRILLIIFGPFIDLYLLWRLYIGKEDRTRFRERLGYGSFPKPEGPLIWFHAASVGESIAILPLIQSITQEYESVSVLITTGTVTSANVLESKLPQRTYHHYVPVDKLHTVRRFLNHWKPDVAVFVESELWPNLVLETYKYGSAMLQVNAKISENSMQRWQNYGNAIHEMLACFKLTLAQTEADKDRMQKLGASNVKYLGNLKFEAPPLPADPKTMGSLVTMIGERPLWLAASTHPDEENQIAAAHKLLKEHHADLLTIIVPRHPERGLDISRELEKQKLTTALRSEDQPIKDSTDIYIADTLGELGVFYRLSGIVFMGGSLVDHGGQNPLEAIRLDSAILAGPHTKNFDTIYKELEATSGMLRVRNIDELFNQVEHLMLDHEFQESVAQAAAKVLDEKAGVLNEYMAQLSAYINPLVAASNVPTPSDKPKEL